MFVLGSQVQPKLHTLVLYNFAYGTVYFYLFFNLFFQENDQYSIFP